MDMESDTGESLLQLEIRKCQQAFAMSTNDEPEEFEDIQFFHRIPPVALSSFKIGGMTTGYMKSESEGEEGFQESESSYMFPENVMEYGEPQFFPGNCVGYLETILEETDEDCEDEDGSSGRHCHWWTPDSDTDTESVIRVDPTVTNTTPSINNPTDDPPQPQPPQFCSSASSVPFELEDLQLFDQLDLAFEETLLKPRRRTGFAFEADLNLPPITTEPETELLDEVVEPFETCTSTVTESPEFDDDEPPVVDEDDFFRSSSSSSSCDENSDLSETESEHSTTSETSSSGSDQKSGKVLAEFSLGGPLLLGSEMYKNNQAYPHRRSFEAPAKIRSFRSFDSLNSLVGTELLFSNPETTMLPIVITNPATGFGIETEAETRSSSSGTDDKETASRKNSGEASSETLSEDSGIQESSPETEFCPGNPPFALNPFVYSSASEENSMLTMTSYRSEVNDIVTTLSTEGDSETSSTTQTSTRKERKDEMFANNSLVEGSTSTRRNNVTKSQSVPMSPLESSSIHQLYKPINPSTQVEPPTSVKMDSRTDYFYEGEFNSLLLLLPHPILPGQIIPSTRPSRGVAAPALPLEHKIITTVNQSRPISAIQEVANEPCTPHWQLQYQNYAPTTTTIPNNSQQPLSNFESEHRNSEDPEEDSEYVTLREEISRKGNYYGTNNAQPSVGVGPWDREEEEVGQVVKSDQSLEQLLSFNTMQLEPTRSTTTSPGGVPIPIKTYGGARNNDVAVYLVSTGSSRTPSPTVTVPPHSHDLPEPSPGTGSLKTKTVHFCPVVSEISWRESYAEPNVVDDEDHLNHYHGDDNGSAHHQEPERDNPVEKVHVHVTEPLSERERLMALEPIQQPPSPSPPLQMSLSTVPDLVSSVTQSTGPVSQMVVGLDEVDTAQKLYSNGDQRPYYYQQQIFPAMFVATAKEVAEVNHVPKKNGKATYVVPPSNNSPVPVPVNKPIPKAGKRPADPPLPVSKDIGKKPGFFQRLTKIRLSGNKSKKPKVFPKEVKIIGPPTNPNFKEGMPSGPILKKGPTSPLLLEHAHTPSKPVKEQDECSEAFETILEEIAGLNTILQRQQFSPPTSSSAASTPSSNVAGGKRLFAERKEFLQSERAPEVGQLNSGTLDSKLSLFKQEAEKTRDQISRSHPDLETIEGVTAPRRHMGSESSPEVFMESGSFRREQQSRGSNNEREWYRLLKTAAEKYYHHGNHGGIGREDQGGLGVTTGIVETDLDTGTSRELLDAELIVLDDLCPPPLPASLPPTSNNGASAKAQSLTNLTTGLKLSVAPNDSSDTIDADAEERARSLEFLLDEEQKSGASPPENKLQLDNHRQLSQHELRIQRSLQKLNVPDWYRRSGRSKSVERDRNRDRDRAELRKDTPLVSVGGTTALQLAKPEVKYGSSGGLAGGWAGLSTYRTPSLSSLHNSGLTTGSLNRSNFVRGRPVTMSAMRSSKESLITPSSTASQSPSAFERSSFTYGMPLTMTRFGQGRLSSTSDTSPANSSPSTPAGQSVTLSTYKQPYLGWRSQERLNTIPASGGSGLKLSTYRSPAERLAADMLRQKKPPTRPTGSDRPPLPRWPTRGGSDKGKTMSLPRPPVEVREDIQVRTMEFPRTASPSIHDSIKEVTDAISEFVSHGGESVKSQPRQRNTGKQAIWFESSFVGKKSSAQ